MLAKVSSATVMGVDACPIEVEVNFGFADTVIVIVGLPDAAVKESPDRVGTAQVNAGFSSPIGKTTINLALADLKKEGPNFDLPIAVVMLAASEQIETDQLENFVVGELTLNGAGRAVKGLLPIALRARAEGQAGVMVQVENAAEAAVVEGLCVIPVRSLREATRFLECTFQIAPFRVDVREIFERPYDEEGDFAEVKGQESVKRALEVVAAGNHNALKLVTIKPIEA